jgi:hypothetical protein
MSAYIIHIEHREEQTLAWVEINGLSNESKSALHCRFQTMGWILSIVDTVNRKVDPNDVLDDDYATNALTNYAKMDPESAANLLAARDWRRRFEAAWQTLNDLEREEAITLDYDLWDNYWPGFDTYNRSLRHFFINFRPRISESEARYMAPSPEIEP